MYQISKVLLYYLESFFQYNFDCGQINKMKSLHKVSQSFTKLYTKFLVLYQKLMNNKRAGKTLSPSLRRLSAFSSFLICTVCPDLLRLHYYRNEEIFNYT